jgi:hypothetical protein
MVCLQPVATPAVFELGLRYPGVKAVPDISPMLSTSTPTKPAARRSSQKESIAATTSMPLSIVSIRRRSLSVAAGHNESCDREPSAGFEYSMGLGREHGQVFEVLSGFHRVTFIERIGCMR